MTQISDPTTSASFHDGDYMLSKPNGMCTFLYRNACFQLFWTGSPTDVIWSSPSGGTPGVTATYVRGDLSIPNVWDTGTGGNLGAKLAVSDAGDATITAADGIVLWDTGTAMPAHVVRLARDLPAARAANPSATAHQAVISTVKAWLKDAQSVLASLEAQLALSASSQGTSSESHPGNGNGGAASYAAVRGADATP